MAASSGRMARAVLGACLASVNSRPSQLLSICAGLDFRLAVVSGRGLKQGWEMPEALTGTGLWSGRALRFLKLSIVMCVLLSVLDGVLHGLRKDELFASPFFQMSIYW